MESEISENNQIIIKSIQQIKKISDAIKARERSERLNEIKDWIDNNNPNFWNIDGSITISAMKIDTIHSYFENKFNKENVDLVENYLCTLLNRLNHLTDEEILLFISNLKAFINNEDADAKLELDRFINKFPSFSKDPDLFKNISQKIFSSYEKYKLNLNNNFKFQSNNESTTELAAEAVEINLDSEYKCPFSENFFFFSEYKNELCKEKNLRKKIKTRIIEFDEDDGIGYDHCSSHWYYKEIKRLSSINLEIELSPRAMFKKELMRMGRICTDEPSLKELKQIQQKELEKKIAEKEFELFATDQEKIIRHRDQEATWKDEEIKNKAKQQAKLHAINQSIKNSRNFKEYQRKNRKKIIEVKKIIKLLNPVLFFIQEQIDQFKKKPSLINDHSLGLKLPSFETMKDDFIADFLKTIDYDKFKELINFSENILFSINEINKTLNKIDVFFQSIGISVEYIRSLDDYHKKIKKNFSKEAIIHFLESSLDLFKQRTLTLDNNYRLLDIEDKKEEIKFLESNFFNVFISNNSLERIYKLNFSYLNKFFIQTIGIDLFYKRISNKKNSVLNILFNFFSGKYYFLSKNSKDKFLKKFLLKIQHFPDLKSIEIEVFKLKWWNFISVGISPLLVFKKGFRKLLSEKLFLNLIEEEFKNIDKYPCIKSIDVLYSIYERLKDSNIAINNQLISLSSINTPQSRQEIIDSFNKHEEVKTLLNKISILATHATWCVNEFSKLLNVLQREYKKISPRFDLSKKEFLKVIEMNRAFISNENTNSFSLSYNGRSIN